MQLPHIPPLAYRLIPVEASLSYAEAQSLRPHIVWPDGKHQPNPPKSALSAKTTSEGQQKRIARNQREKKRAHKIAEVIDDLKDTLDRAAYPASSSSKYDILVAAEDLIRNLELHAQCLEMEKLLRKAVNSIDTSIKQDTGGEHARPVFLYYNYFETHNFSMAVASPDGRILSFNKQFSYVTGCNKPEGLTMFMLVSQSVLKDFYSTVGRMLSESDTKEYSFKSCYSTENKCSYTVVISLIFSEANVPSGYSVSLIDLEYGCYGRKRLAVPYETTASVVSNDSG